MSIITTLFRGLIYLIGLLIFSPLLVPSLLVGAVWCALRIGFILGLNLVSAFLLGFQVTRRERAAGLPRGIAFGRRHPKGR